MIRTSTSNPYISDGFYIGVLMARAVLQFSLVPGYICLTNGELRSSSRIPAVFSQLFSFLVLSMTRFLLMRVSVLKTQLTISNGSFFGGWRTLFFRSVDFI